MILTRASVPGHGPALSSATKPTLLRIKAWSKPCCRNAPHPPAGGLGGHRDGATGGRHGDTDEGDRGQPEDEHHPPVALCRHGRRLAKGPPVAWPAVERSYVVRTFGCQMNEHDSERIAGLLEADGMVAASDSIPSRNRLR